MPTMCQCRGDCGYALCCRKPGMKRKQGSEQHELCWPCRGGTGRDRQEFRKRPASAAPSNPPVPAAPAVRSNVQLDAGPMHGPLPAASSLDRIASALERLAARAAAPTAAVPSSSTAQERSVQLPVPRSLEPLLAAGLAAAGQQNGASTVVSAFGFPEGHARRALVFAALNAVLAVAAPHTNLPGLRMVRPEPQSSDACRTQRFCQEHRSLCMQAIWSNGSASLATVIQSVARGLRHSAELRQRHGQRFLEEVGIVIVDARSSAGGAAGGGEGAAGGCAPR